MTIKMEKEKFIIEMAMNMKVIGKIINMKEKEHSIMKMEIYMKVNGRKI